MQINTRHIVALIFILIIALPCISMMSLMIKQQWHSAHSEERMEEEELVKIQVPSEDLVWQEEGREVTIKGKFFDLASWKLENGIYHLTGVFDDDETEMAEQQEEGRKLFQSLISLFMIAHCFAASLYYLFNFRFHPDAVPLRAGRATVYSFLFSKKYFIPPRF